MMTAKITGVLGALLLLAIGLSGCTMSEKDSCKASGGVWRGSFCEMPGK